MHNNKVRKYSVPVDNAVIFPVVIRKESVGWIISLRHVPYPDNIQNHK